MKLSVIVPAHNAAHYLRESLSALLTAADENTEIIIVDDGSTDETTQVAQQFAHTVIANQMDAGPGGARNAGAAIARGDVLVFIDADVVVHPDTLQKLEAALQQRPDVAAVFGLYDANPPSRTTVSLFKNLFHHYVHQHASENAYTFWTGCGAVRREVFEQIGGFGVAGIALLEDVDYGHRMRDAGLKIWLRPDIQVTHLKRWTLTNLVWTDVFRRGIPWTVMLLRRGKTEKDLNFTLRQKLCTLAACVLLPVTAAIALLIARGATPLLPLLWLIPLLLLTFVTSANAGMFRFFASRGGLLFALACVPLLLLYYHYSAFAFAAGVLWYAMHPGLRKQGSSILTPQ